jgi:hypothetical protein
MSSLITKAGEDMIRQKHTHTVRVGEMYQPAKERRETTIRVGDTDIMLRENLWSDTDDKFDTDNKWSITTYLHVSQECGTKEEVFTSATDNLKVVKALGVLGYELHSMEEDGVGIWDRPAEDR